MADDIITEDGKPTPEDERLVTARIVTIKGQPVTHNGVPLVVKVPPKAARDEPR
ncbi:MAG TPA: hypothetical protein VLA19_29845 [Herpetosiphonaceae bacterium]|nr:hypothetical protein [Herpetosiphonaceae bacterium]